MIHDKEELSKEEEWDPEKAEQRGKIKGMLEIKFRAPEIVKLDIETVEPKLRKTKPKAEIVDSSKRNSRNSRALF